MGLARHGALPAAAAVMGLMATAPARAADEIPVQPAVAVRVAFGGASRAQPALSLRLQYPEAARLSPDATLPALLDWTLDGSGTQALRANGLLLGASRLWLGQDEAPPPAPASSSWGPSIGLMVLATGGALALVVASAGDAADDISENYSWNGGGNGDGKVDPVCAPADVPATGDCVIGGGDGG